MERLSVSESISKRWITLNSEVVGGRGGVGDSAYERGGDARRKF